MPHSTTGRIDTYSSPLFSRPSRAFNRSEQDERFQALETAMETRIEQVYEDMAQQFLAMLRDMLAPHNTSRHNVTIMAGMGSAAVLVNGNLMQDYTLNTPVVARLNEIDQILEGGWSWACYLDGKTLNPSSQKEARS